MPSTSCGKGNGHNNRAVHDDPVIKSTNFLKQDTNTHPGQRKLKVDCGKGRNSVCRPSKNDHIDPESYLHENCPISAAIYQDPKRYEKELWKCKRIYAKYNSKDRILLTPPMLLGRANTNKVSSDLIASSENITSGSVTKVTDCKTNSESEDSTDSVISQSRKGRIRRKGRYRYKASRTTSRDKACYLKSILKHDKKYSYPSLKRSYLIEKHGLHDINSNYSIDEKLNEINNNVIRNDKVLGSKMKMMADKKISKIPETSSSVDFISYPPEICPEYFYRWVRQLPIGKFNSCPKTHYNCEVLYNPCIPCECRCPCPREGNIQESKSIVKSTTSRPNHKVNDHKIPNWEIKDSQKAIDCPDFHNVEIPKYDLQEFSAEVKKRQAMLFCQQRNFALDKNREPIFYKLNKGEVKPPTAERDYIWENSVKVLRMGRAKPEKFFIDDKKGSRHNFIRSGLAPIYITGDQFGKVPQYLEERRKAQGLPPCDLSIYRVKKRCFKCGHDHSYCQHKMMEEEKIREAINNVKKNRYHSPGVIPAHYNDICMNATWGY